MESKEHISGYCAGSLSPPPTPTTLSATSCITERAGRDSGRERLRGKEGGEMKRRQQGECKGGESEKLRFGEVLAQEGSFWKQIND